MITINEENNIDSLRVQLIARPLLLGLWVIVCVSSCSSPEEPVIDRRPDVLLIVADDLAYTDLGVYGGEIGTPHLDVLARNGVLFENFYTASTCSPARSMLLTGVDNHLVGFGTMTGDHVGDQLGAPGYETYLNFRAATMPELFQEAGYGTYMAGKWHLGGTDDAVPSARGFDRSFVLIEGGGGHFDTMGMFSAKSPATYKEDGRSVELPEQFYSTSFYAKKMVEYIDEAVAQDQSFFGYLAFSAPHWPLQAPDSSIARFKGRYDNGYEALYESRLASMKAQGLFPGNAKPHPGRPDVPAWDELSARQQRIEAKKMEIYAAMVSDLDTYVGVVVNHLKAVGRFDNTMIVFMSDNGAEGHDLVETWPFLEDWIAECCDNSYENMGRPDSYIDYGPAWARAGIGPYRMYKGFSNEGGLRAPAFIHFGDELDLNGWSRDFVTVKDIMPTLLDVAHIAHPTESGGTYKGREVLPMQGRSMWPYLTGQTDSVHGKEPVMGWELFGRRAIRKGDWKLVWTTAPFGPSSWELFDLSLDPGELNDISDQYPEITSELIALWDAYVEKNGVVVSEEPLAY